MRVQVSVHASGGEKGRVSCFGMQVGHQPSIRDCYFRLRLNRVLLIIILNNNTNNIKYEMIFK